VGFWDKRSVTGVTPGREPFRKKICLGTDPRAGHIKRKKKNFEKVDVQDETGGPKPIPSQSSSAKSCHTRRRQGRKKMALVDVSIVWHMREEAHPKDYSGERAKNLKPPV